MGNLWLIPVRDDPHLATAQELRELRQPPTTWGHASRRGRRFTFAPSLDSRTKQPR